MKSHFVRCFCLWVIGGTILWPQDLMCIEKNFVGEQSTFVQQPTLENQAITGKNIVPAAVASHAQAHPKPVPLTTENVNSHPKSTPFASANSAFDPAPKKHARIQSSRTSSPEIEVGVEPYAIQSHVTMSTKGYESATPSTSATPSRTSSPEYFTSTGPLTFNQFDLSDNFETSSTSSLASSPEYFTSTGPLTFNQFDLSDNFETSSTSSGASSPEIEVSVKPYAMPTALTISDAGYDSASPSTSATSSLASTPTNSQASSPETIYSTKKEADFNTADLINRRLAEQTKPNNMPNKISQPSGNIPAGLRLAINASDAFTNAKQAIQKYSNQIYRMPGRVAKNLLGHPDGKFITGDRYSINSAGKTLYNMAATAHNSIKNSLYPKNNDTLQKNINQTLDDLPIADPMSRNNRDIAKTAPLQAGNTTINKNAFVDYDSYGDYESNQTY